jgi:hypothetical protein
VKAFHLQKIIILVIIIINFTIWWKFGSVEEKTFWMKLPEGAEASLSWAGVYFLKCCMPLVQFILLRWLWRWVIWFIFFLKISKLPLRLRPSHADKAGGIGFLGGLTMASSLVISALPMLPLFALQYSVAEILQKVLKLLV